MPNPQPRRGVAHPKRIREMPSRVTDNVAQREVAADTADATWQLVNAIEALADELKSLRQDVTMAHQLMLDRLAEIRDRLPAPTAPAPTPAAPAG